MNKIEKVKRDKKIVRICIVVLLFMFSIFIPGLSSCKAEVLETVSQTETTSQTTIVSTTQDTTSEASAAETTEPETNETTPLKEGEVTFITEDNVEINGNVFGAGGKWVILSHMYPTDQTSWFDFAKFLKQEGFEVLTYDFRGYGHSKGSKEFSKINFDLKAAVDFIRLYNPKKIFLIGASMGGTASIVVSSEIKIDGVIIISAPLEFKGLNAIDVVNKVSCPKLFIASKGDGLAADSAKTFYEKSLESKDIKILDGSAHGTFIFNQDPKNAEILKNLIIDFLNKN
jgi:pimeloyl-ACP methyl ester carboxylesterase